MISDDEPDAAIYGAIESLEKRFGADVVAEILRRHLKASGKDYEMQSGPDNSEASREEGPRLATPEEIQELLEHAAAHQWKDRAVRRSPTPAARRFLHVTYDRWLGEGIQIPLNVLRKADPDLHNALYYEVGAAGLHDEGIVATYGREEAVSSVKASPRRPGIVDDELSVSDGSALAHARRFPTESEIEEMTAHAETHQWKDRPVRRSLEPAARQFLRTTYAKWLERFATDLNR